MREVDEFRPRGPQGSGDITGGRGRLRGARRRISENGPSTDLRAYDWFSICVIIAHIVRTRTVYSDPQKLLLTTADEPTRFGR